MNRREVILAGVGAAAVGAAVGSAAAQQQQPAAAPAAAGGGARTALIDAAFGCATQCERVQA